MSHPCGSEIVRWARHVIESNPGRPADKQRLVTPEGAPGGETAFLAFPTQASEMETVLKAVKPFIKSQ